MDTSDLTGRTVVVTGAGYQRRNYGPERVAVNILKAVERNRAVAPVAPEAWISWAVTRLSPRLAGWTARRMAAAAE